MVLIFLNNLLNIMHKCNNVLFFQIYILYGTINFLHKIIKINMEMIFFKTEINGKRMLYFCIHDKIVWIIDI
jgi:hypothetical protein